MATVPPVIQNTAEQVHLLHYWHILRKHRWVLLSTMAVLVTVVTIGSFLMTPTYRATTIIQIERQNPNIADINDFFTRDSTGLAYTDFYRTQYRLIRSREVLQRVIQGLDLPQEPVLAAELRPGFLSRLKNWSVELLGGGKKGFAADEMEPWIRLVEKHLSVDSVRNTHLVEISFVSIDADLAARVANAVADEYIYFNSEVKSRATGIAGSKLDVEIKKLTRSIEAEEQQLRVLGEERSIVDLGNKKSLALTSLEEVTHSLTEARILRARRQASYEAIKKADPSSLDAVIQSISMRDLKARLTDLEREYAEKGELFKPGYPEMVALNNQIQVVREQLKAEQDRLRNQSVAAAETAYQTARREEQRLKTLEQGQKEKVHQLEKSLAQYETLKESLDARRTMRAGLIKRRDETGVLNRMDDTLSGNIWQVEKAKVPMEPFRPDKKLNIFLALLLGSSLGVGLVFFFEYLDNSIKDAEELERETGLPALGIIPGLRRRAGGKVVRLDAGGRSADVDCVTHEAPRSNVAEAYRDLRTTLLLSTPDGPPRLLMVTSSQPREGKTVTSLNIAISLTQLGKRVLLLDADLRKPGLHKALGMSRKEGLSSFLAGNAAWKELVVPTRIPSLSLLSAGPISPNPAELLASQILAGLLAELREGKSFDHVVVDTPPLLAVADALIVSGFMDGVLIVVQAGVTPRQTVNAGIEKLRAAKVRVLGAVLNNLDLSQHGYYAYRYGYRYGHRTAYYGADETDRQEGDDSLEVADGGTLDRSPNTSRRAGREGRAS
ncbi:MAG: GumC family protein [Acidobacteriota bacterium]